MSSSEDDRPLALPRQNGARMNGTKGHPKPVGPAKISGAIEKQVQQELDKMDVDIEASNATAGVSLRNGPIREVEVDGRDVGDHGSRSAVKRKVVKPAVKEESGSESDQPLTKRRRTHNGAKGSTPVVESSDDDVPLASKVAPKRRKTSSPRTEMKKPPILMGRDDTSDSDVPIVSRQLAKEKTKIKNEAAKTAKALQAEEKKSLPAKRRKPVVKDESDSDAPIKKRRGPTAKKANGVKKEESSDDDKPLARSKAKKVQVVKKDPVIKEKGKARKEETPAATEEGEEEGEEYKWWEHQEENDGTQKWSTLEHNGVIFPPEYEPLPSNVKMKYGGVFVTLPIEAEEVADFFGAMLDSPHTKNSKFVSNFFADFKEIVKGNGGAKDPEGKKIALKDFEKCDFTAIFNHHEAKKTEKKSMTATEKKALKTEKDEAEKKYQWCLLDGRKEKVGNFRIEPPGLFRGRGEHPKTGKVKQRVQPEQITINIGKGVPVPPPPPGHKWGEVRHDNTVTWLATWKENINGNIKYVMLAATSSVKGQSDYKKFEKARELKKHINRIRRDYKKDLKSEMMADRQRATAMYLIDEFALRAGNEKGEEEADTVGCCSLRFEHITLAPPNKVIFDFLGKDSIRFHQEVAVDPQVFKNLKIFKKEPKGPGDMIFDRLETTALNKHLQSYMPGLSAKVFRTYNASWTMQRQLQEIPNEGTVMDKYAAYNEANRKVAILCNHQRTVSTTHEASMERAQDRIKALRYQKLRLKRQILYLEPKRKNRNPDFFKPDPEIDDEDWVRNHQKDLIEQEREKIAKKFAKENEKLVADGEKEQKASVLDERLQILKEMKEDFDAENKSGMVEPKIRGPTIEKVEASLEKMEERIRKMEVEVKVKDDNKTVALGTSKINYIDPRLTVMFCDKYNVPIEKLFPKTLREKFKWALQSADKNWEF